MKKILAWIVAIGSIITICILVGIKINTRTYLLTGGSMKNDTAYGYNYLQLKLYPNKDCRVDYEIQGNKGKEDAKWSEGLQYVKIIENGGSIELFKSSDGKQLSKSYVIGVYLLIFTLQ